MIRSRTDNQKNVRLARRGRNEKTESMDIVIRVIKLLHLVQASTAVARIDHQDV